MLSKKTNSPREAAPIRVFVGTSANGEDAEACMVLESSLRRHASVPVEIEWMRLSHDPESPYSGWLTQRWSTPWTAFRWAVPALCGGRGRAVYLDCPQIVLGDIAEVAHAQMDTHVFMLARRAGKNPQLSCLVFDCTGADSWLPGLAELRGNLAAHQDIGRLLTSQRRLVGELPAGWGVSDLDYSMRPTAVGGSVHCTNLYMQPHSRYALPRLHRAGGDHWFTEVRLPHYCSKLVQLFDEERAVALAAGYTVEQYVPKTGYGVYAIQGADRLREEERI